MTRKQRTGKKRPGRTASADSPRRFAAPMVLLAFLAVTLFVYFKGYRLLVPRSEPGIGTDLERQALTGLLADDLRSMGIKREWIRERDAGTAVKTVEIRVPRQISLVTCNLRAHNLFRQAQVTIHAAKEEPARGQLVLTAGNAGTLEYAVTFRRDGRLERENARIAVVLDGAGGSMNAAVRAFMDIDAPLTLALVPGGEDVTAITARAATAGKEIMVDLPVVPERDALEDDNPFMVAPGLSLQQLRQRLTLALAAVPGSRGVRHDGTGTPGRDRTLAGRLQDAARASSVYYIGPAESGCPAADLTFTEAHRIGIRATLDEAARTAFQGGAALVSGRLHRETVRVLGEYLPRLRDRGITFVPVSQLLEARS